MKRHLSNTQPLCTVAVLNRQREIPFSIDPSSVTLIVQTVLEMESTHASFVNIHFLSDKVMRKYHAQFFQDPSSTDCMSFPLDEEGENRHLGDIFVCPKTALLYAKNSESDFFREITLYIIHGLLHLLGYDDIDPKDRAIMRRKERSSLLLLEERNISLCGTLKIKTQF